MASDKNRKIAERLARLYCELWSTGDLNIIDQIFAPGVRDVAGFGQPWATFIAGMRRTFPDLERPLESTIIDGDVLVLRSTVYGTHTGDGGFFKFPPTGVRMSMSAVTAFRIEDGKLANEIWSEYDLQPVVREMAEATVSQYAEQAWGDGDEAVVRSHVASGYVGRVNGAEIDGRRRLRAFIAETRKKWDHGHFRLDQAVAGGDWGGTVSYRWTAGEPGLAPGGVGSAVSAIAIARLVNGRVTEEWIQIS